MELDKFHKLVGETIMYCQRLENDIKLIYAGMLAGNLEDNLKDLEKKTLGMIINLLEELDNSDDDPYFDDDDYKLMNELKDIRNHWAHEAYCNFIYSDKNNYSKNFQREYRRLKNDHNRLKKVCGLVKKVSLQVLEEFGRI